MPAAKVILGAPETARVGHAGTPLLLGVIVIVCVGLGVRAVYANWRAAHEHRPA